MKFKYLATLAAASIITLSFAGTSLKFNSANAGPCAANPCASVDPCSAAGKNPCASLDPCAGAADPCAGVDPCAANPCAADPCAGKNPCAANPCAADPCAGVDPCAANPCAGADPCAANPCAGKNPCAGVDPCAANPCAAADGDSAPLVYTESSSGLAIRGTDPVAYFTEGEAVAGSTEYETEWQDAVWRFASAENQELFEEDPEAYAPQYGGYCAKALSEGNVVSVDPEAWKIVDGKLYLNYSKEVQEQWSQDVPGNIALADEMWPNVLEGATVFE